MKAIKNQIISLQTLAIATTFMLFTLPTKAQWIVTDPVNLTQGIINTTRQIIQTSATVSNTVKTFQETAKVYQQGKLYYDQLRSVHNLVKDARRVQQTLLLVGDITDIYVNNYQRMLHDRNFTPDELTSIAFGYAQLLQESTNLLLDLKNAVNINGLSMTDKDRMDVVNQVYNSIKEYRDLTQYYTNRTIGTSLLRAKQRGEVQQVIDLYGNANERYW